MAIAAGTKPHPIFLAGRWVESPDLLVVANPADPSSPPAATFHATEAQYEEAVEAAVAAFEVTRKLPAYERGRILREISAGIKARREELGRLIALEAGKPIRDALVEVDRATLTFRLGAEEAERMTGEVIPLDLHARRRKDRVGITRRFPIGPIAGDQPVQLPAEPRRAQARAGDRVGQPDRPQAAVQGPADDARPSPRSSRRRASRPARSAILPMTRELGDRMVADERFKLLTFTGQPVGRLADEGARRQEEGRARARRQRRRHRGQDRRPRLGRQADPRRRRSPTPARSASASSGCSSTRTSGTRSWTRFVAGAQALKMGDPLDPRRDLGPMVDDAAAARTQRWVDEAVALGGTVARWAARPTARSSRRRSSRTSR